MLPFLRSIFYDGFKLRQNPSKDQLGFLDHLGICFKVSDAQLMFQQWKQPELTGCEVQAAQWIFFALMLWRSSHSCIRVPYVSQVCCLDEESAIEEALVVSTRYDQGVFPVSSCNTNYLSMFLEGRHVNRL